MLTSSGIIATVAQQLEKFHNGKHLIIDPVMVSTSGSRLIAEDSIDNYVDKLIPMATLITPNIPEAQEIVSRIVKNEGGLKPPIKNINDVKRMAEIILSIGPKAVLIKGGHLGLKNDLSIAETPEEARKIVDILYDGTEFHLFESAYLQSTHTHGTGCTLAAAIASNLAKGLTVDQAVDNGIKYVQRAIATAFPLGHGSGPVNHMHNLQFRSFIPDHFIDFLLNHPKVKPHWIKYINHPFTKKIAYGTIEQMSFKYFLMQGKSV